MDKLWTTGVHDYAETLANTRFSAFDLLPRIGALASRPGNKIWSPSLLVRKCGGREFAPPAVQQPSLMIARESVSAVAAAQRTAAKVDRRN